MNILIFSPRLMFPFVKHHLTTCLSQQREKRRKRREEGRLMNGERGEGRRRKNGKWSSLTLPLTTKGREEGAPLWSLFREKANKSQSPCVKTLSLTKGRKTERRESESTSADKVKARPVLEGAKGGDRNGEGTCCTECVVCWVVEEQEGKRQKERSEEFTEGVRQKNEGKDWLMMEGV